MVSLSFGKAALIKRRERFLEIAAEKRAAGDLEVGAERFETAANDCVVIMEENKKKLPGRTPKEMARVRAAKLKD